MSFFLSFLFWVFSAHADVNPAEIQTHQVQSPTSVQRVVPASRTMPMIPNPKVRSRTGGGTVIILEDTHFKPLR